MGWELPVREEKWLWLGDQLQAELESYYAHRDCQMGLLPS